MGTTRDDAIRIFRESGIHRQANRRIYLTVFVTAVMCIGLINPLPTSYLNYLIPLTLAIGLSTLFRFAIVYQQKISSIIRKTGLGCQHCGQSTVARPDCTYFRSRSRHDNSACFHCGMMVDAGTNPQRTN